MILIRRPWTRQPPATRKPAIGSPLCAGLSALFDCGLATELISGQRASNRTSSLVARPLGQPDDYSGGSNQQYPHIDAYAITGPLTIVCALELDALSQYSAIISKQATTTTYAPYEWRLSDSATDGKMAFLRSKTVGYRPWKASSAIVSASASTVQVLAMRSNGSVVETPVDAFVNGVKTALTTTYTDTGAIADNGSSTVWIGRRYDGATYLDGRIYYVALWARGLSDAEIGVLSQNPWSVYAPRRIDVPVSGISSGLPTLTALTASNITTSGWRATLTAA